MKKATMQASKKSPQVTSEDVVTDPKVAESASRVLRHFRSVFNAVKTHFQQVEKHAGIGGAQVWALSTIKAQPGIGMTDLAMAMDIHQTTASNLVKGLLKLEVVKVEKKGPDKRAVQLYVLPAGRALLKKVPGPFAGVLPKALSELDAKTLLRLERDLNQLLVLLNTDEQAAKTPLAQL
jgi:DNA-binding MarR family transcriptional regulator